MKIRSLLVFSVVLLTFASCKKKIDKSLTLVRDCTATYLRDGDLDLPVANASILADLDSGEVVSVTYYFPKTKKAEFRYGECTEEHDYPRGEWIMIEEIN